MGYRENRSIASGKNGTVHGGGLAGILDGQVNLIHRCRAQ